MDVCDVNMEIAHAFQLTTPQPLHACFSVENGELVEVCFVIHLRHGFQMAEQLL